MKKIVLSLLILIVLASCHFDKNMVSKAKTDEASKVSDTVRIANDSLQYEVIIIDGGFNSWLAGHGKPRGFYSETYLENRNQTYVSEWNSRVSQPQRYNPDLYEMRINYDSNIHYGYEVNYLIYNYMIYFQIVNKQQLSGFVPRP
ncbi:DUF6146 family protein [Flavobacterium sp. N1994]|uniref:DUF6146 family protein n=1 Tax=Flavobacterium sp. N1994 TaxID=2986827 RepID=UPI0022233741|nr:DUF6146 family protein [Flavobacterium sp. N1994]